MITGILIILAILGTVFFLIKNNEKEINTEIKKDENVITSEVISVISDTENKVTTEVNEKISEIKQDAISEIKNTEKIINENI